MAVILLGGVVLLPRELSVSGSQGVIQMAQVLGDRFGRPGELVFLVGFWGSVATSIVGVWQGVPYMFGNYVGLLRGAEGADMDRYESQHGWIYRGYVLFMTFPPMVLLLMDRPVWLVVVYAAVGSLFMPFLAGTLLVMNNKRDLGTMRNGFLANAMLVVAVALFVVLMVNQLRSEFAKVTG